MLGYFVLLKPIGWTTPVLTHDFLLGLLVPEALGGRVASEPVAD
jgi:hypothetical protein